MFGDGYMCKYNMAVHNDISVLYKAGEDLLMSGAHS